MAKEKKYNRTKLKLSRWILAKGLKNLEYYPITCSLEKATTVGITFAATSPKDLEEIKKILKDLALKGIKTSVLGYIPEKKASDFYLSEKSFNFFYDKELNWLLQPISPAALEFQESKFDLLIDFGSISFYPMEILINKSKARFKVGQYIENGPFDLMINLTESSNIRYYFDQVGYYLSKFN